MIGAWHMTPLWDQMAHGPLSRGRADRPATYTNVDGVAVIQITGPTTKYGVGGTQSTMRTRDQVRQAIADPSVGAIALLIDSPGGAVSGNMELADDVFEASKRKITIAYASDMMASAAYEVGSQAESVYANPAALIGSIGTMMQLYDVSGMFEQYGIRAIPITSGGMKGVGLPGTQITDEQVAYFQNIIDGLTTQFVSAVSRGRRVDYATAQMWADGRVHLAAHAAQLGLIDGVMPLDQAITELRNRIS